jgi:hypothetical protein
VRLPSVKEFPLASDHELTKCPVYKPLNLVIISMSAIFFRRYSLIPSNTDRAAP